MMKGSRLSTVILVLLAVALLYLLYIVTGGDWTAWMGAITQSGNPLEMIADSLSALAHGIGDLFVSIAP